MSHTHEPQGGRRLILSLALTALILLAEVIGGWLTGSLALLSDAAHVFLDMFALGLSYAALRVAELPPDDRHTYGFQRAKVLAALINGATLLGIAFEILREAWHRAQHPGPIQAGPMLVIAVIGLLVNIGVALLLSGHAHDDLNTRSAFLHVLGDTLASVGVILAGVILLFTDWTWVDPLVSVLIGLIVLLGAVRVLRESFHILVEGVPDGIVLDEVREVLRSVPGVLNVHDLHVWSVAPGYPAMSAHLVLTDRSLSDSEMVLHMLRQRLAEQFHIQHTTIQFECHNCGQGAETLRPASSHTH